MITCSDIHMEVCGERVDERKSKGRSVEGGKNALKNWVGLGEVPLV